MFFSDTKYEVIFNIKSKNIKNGKMSVTLDDEDKHLEAGQAVINLFKQQGVTDLEIVKVFIKNK